MSYDKAKNVIEEQERKSANRDPLTGTPGAHPVGAGAGAAAGGAAGAAIGAIGGPVGAVVGAVVGGVAGGLAGKAVAESVDPTIEDAYWRSNYSSRPYVESGSGYDVYQPAYRYGWESRAQHGKRSWNDVEADLARDWDKRRGQSNLSWERAKSASRDAWNRVERVLPGDSDRDGS